jgi:hydrogenase nickel incorporation protein HypA/HybF
MHELAVTCGVVELVREAAKGRRVLRVTVEIGKLSGVVPDAVAFCFPVATKGTSLEEAELEIREVDGFARCSICDREFPTPSMMTICRCGSSRLTRIRGEELNLKSIEVEEI